jgi:hypothetical protein
MKVLLLTAITLLACTSSWSQDVTSRPVDTGALEITKNEIAVTKMKEQVEPVALESFRFEFLRGAAPKYSELARVSGRAAANSPYTVEKAKCCAVGGGAEADETDLADDSINPKEKFHWKSALAQSMAFLAFQHSFRMTQEKTRDGLHGGPFFRDWGQSIKNIRTWRDGDNFVTNYIGHPMQGSFTGRIFVNNSDRAKKQEFGSSKEYWRSRAKALLWSAVWSTQFEIGPVSEATIGRVGLTRENGYCTMAYVDLVITPVMGTAFLVGEDAIDKYFLKNWVEKSNNKFKIKLLRSFATPTTSIANLIRLKPPWKRDNRPL